MKNLPNSAMSGYRGRCAHCTIVVQFTLNGYVAAHDPRDTIGTPGRTVLLSDVNAHVLVTIHTCPSCRRASVVLWQGDSTAGKLDPTQPRQLWPAHHGRTPPPPEVPEDMRQDYEEACAILNISPQSSAGLARRILQALLVRAGDAPRNKRLEVQIDHVVAKGAIPTALTEHLHALRHLGNLSVHELVDRETNEPIRPDPGLVGVYLDMILQLFDHFYVVPAKASAAKARLNEMHARARKDPIP